MYHYDKNTDLSFEETIIKTAEEVKKEGFGVLTEIDVKKTMKKKLNVEFDNYTILGACNPPFAHEALIAERNIGLMLPCNVIVHELQGDVFVSAVLPAAAMGMIDNTALSTIAAKVEEKLRRVIDNV